MLKGLGLGTYGLDYISASQQQQQYKYLPFMFIIQTLLLYDPREQQPTAHIICIWNASMLLFQSDWSSMFNIAILYSIL